MSEPVGGARMSVGLSFDPKLIISCVTKSKGPLTKIMSLDPETGQVVKDGSECSMHSGTIIKIGISSPSGFARMLSSRAENQAIVHGVCEHDTAKVVTKDKVGQVMKSNPTVIARTKDFIDYQDGPGVILFDHDKARPGSVGSEEALLSYAPADLLVELATVHPDIGKAAFVSTPSTSSCIYNAAGEVLRGEGTGSHTYLFVRQASDIPRYLKVLGKRLFLSGLGRIEISRSGSLLERTLVDLMVGSPERLDFVAGAVCRDGLVQHLPAPVVVDGDTLDTTTLMDLTAEEEKQYGDKVAALKVQAKPQQKTVIAEYITSEAGKLIKVQNITLDEAKRIIESRQHHILEDGDVLFFYNKEGGVTVAEVLDAGPEYHGKSLADPLEPGYENGSKTKAKFFWNDGNPIIHSYAHGSVKFLFRRFVKERAGVATGEDGYYPEETEQALAKMNAEYAGVLLGGDFRIVQERGNTLSFLKITSFYSFFANARVKVPVGDKGGFEYRELAKVWMSWSYRRTFDNVVFDPSGKVEKRSYNLFRGFPFTPKKGDWSLMRQHLLDVLCCGNQEHFEYLVAWMARLVQDPGGDKPGVAIVLKGGKGIGKGVFANYFGAIFGEAFLPIADSESFTGKFNMHLSKSLLVFLDEAIWGGDKRAEGRLKQLITEPTVMFEPKGVDALALRSHVNVIIASNEEWVVPATGDERRFFVLNPSEKFKKNTAYFGKIIKEQMNGGVEGMMYDLLRHDYSGVDLRKAPITEGLSEQVEMSLPSTMAFWRSVLSRGYLLSQWDSKKPLRSEAETQDTIGQWGARCFKHEIYREYSDIFCRGMNDRYPAAESAFWKKSRNLFPVVEIRPSIDGSRPRAVKFPDLQTARASFTVTTGIRFDEESPEDDGYQYEPFTGQF